MRDNFEAKLVRRILGNYKLDAAKTVLPHSGTAAKTWKVVTDAGAWLVRSRGVRTSSDDALAFDHGLRRHLVEHGVPTAAPVAARDGRTFTRLGDKVYEVYPFVAGRSIERAGSTELAGAARALARFHQVAATYPDAKTAPPAAQYATVGVDQTSERLEDPRLLAIVYDRVSSEPEARQFGDAPEVCKSWLERLNADMDDTAYNALPKTVTHNDYTLANLLFDADGRVVGIFDLDWARWEPRIRDVVDGMYFIGAARRTPLNPGDIWSLTETADFDVDRCVTWLDAYREVTPLSSVELDTVPLVFAARWLSVRVEGMAKVPAEERVRFCFRNITDPLRWVEENWNNVRGTLL